MDPLKYTYIKREILKLTSIDLNYYKAPQMQRRLEAYLVRGNYPNWPRFFRTLQADPVECRNFKNYLTINVSSFFRDPAKYKHLQRKILPKLLERRAALQVWSAGCSRGQEAYSLAILLTEASGSSYRHHILATDIDFSALEWAKARGPYSAEDVDNVPLNLRRNYFHTNNDQFWVNDELRQKVTFRQHNFLTDPIVGKFDLIVCRNVVIYFESDVKDELYRSFYGALRPQSVLFVGGTELIPKASAIGFESVGTSFYQRRV